MNAVLEPELHPSRPSAASRAMIERLIGFKTVSRDSNLGLIEWARDYLQGFGATTRLTYDATGKKANLFATLGDSKKPGLILSGHTDVVPVDGQPWDTDPFVAIERDGKLFARGSADMNRFRCRVLGCEAHSSYVTHGVNAIEYAARLVVFIRQIADRLAQIETRDYGFTVPYSTMSTGLIHGGIASNVIPKDCVFQFDMRTLPSTAPDTLYQEIRAYAQDLAREMQKVDDKSGIDLEWVSQTVGLAAAETDAIVQWAMQLSRNHQVGKVSYGTEAGLFQKMGVPSVICGPGDIAQAHRPNEFVTLEQLAQCEKFMDRILEKGYAA